MAPEGNKLNDLQGTAPVSHIAELVQIARKNRVDCWPYSDKTTRSLEYVGVISQLLININILMGSILKPYPQSVMVGFEASPSPSTIAGPSHDQGTPRARLIPRLRRRDAAAEISTTNTPAGHPAKQDRMCITCTYLYHVCIYCRY